MNVKDHEAIGFLRGLRKRASDADLLSTIDNLEAKVRGAQWTRCSEGLPPEAGRVLVWFTAWTSDATPEVLRLEPAKIGGLCWFDECDELFSRMDPMVHFWMPLPNPPQVVSK